MLAHPLRRVDGHRVTGVHTCALDVLHDAGDQDVSAVTDRVDLTLQTIEVAIHQHRLVRAGMHSIAHVPLKFLSTRDDGHSTPTDDV